MKIQCSDSGKVDFAAPIFANETQRKKIVGFFKENFPGIEILENVKEKDKIVNTKNRVIKHWTAEELYLLIQPMTSEEICEKTGRNIMSVNLKRAGFEPDLRVWLRRKGYNFPGTKENIEEYLKSQGDKE